MIAMSIILQQAQVALAEIMYKPTWELEIKSIAGMYYPRSDEYQLVVRFDAVDVNNHDYTAHLLRSEWFRLKKFKTPEKFQLWVQGVIKRAEAHEHDEWFRVGRKMLHDPHADKRPQPGWL